MLLELAVPRVMQGRSAAAAAGLLLLLLLLLEG
jgi:hypothetical protein